MLSLGVRRARGASAVKRIRINGVPVEPAAADVVEAEPGVYSVLAGGKSFEARLEGGGVGIAGHRFPVEIEDPRKWKRSDRRIRDTR